MKSILLVAALSVGLMANWDTSPELADIELSKTYEAKLVAQKTNIKMCQKHVAKALHFRDSMKDTPRNQAKLIHYKSIVMFYCSEVADCNCRRK